VFEGCEVYRQLRASTHRAGDSSYRPRSTMKPLFLVLALFAALIGTADSTLAREDERGLPILPLDARTGMQELDGADKIVRSIHLNWYRVYRPARDTLETPIAMRVQTTYWRVHWSVIAATKRVGSSGSEMLDPIIHLDGTYRVPSYKLPKKQIDKLHKDEHELQLFRAKTLACSLYRWYEVSLKHFMRDPRIVEMEAYLLDLGRLPRDRTNEAAIAVGMAFPNFVVNVKTPCLFARRQGRPVDKTPECVAEKIAMRIEETRHNDGWNESGMDRGSGQLSPFPFRDTIGYFPTHMSPSRSGSRRNWAPIVECSQGSCASQEFVTPHIGFTAQYHFLNKTDISEIVSQETVPIEVDYEMEIRDVIEQTKKLATDPLSKTKIGAYDNKFIFADAYGQILARNENSWEEVVYWAFSFLLVEYEGTLITWRSKVQNDHVRPTTVAQEILGNEVIESFQYGEDTTKSYPANQWNPYIRVMPHAEFPSGSACLCSAASAITAQLYGKKYDDPFPLNVTFNINTVEDRLSGKNFQDHFSTLKDYADDCSNSRYWGGMHFRFSLQPAARMCTVANDFTRKGEALAQYLWTGHEDFLAPFGGYEAFGYKGDRAYTWY